MELMLRRRIPVNERVASFNDSLLGRFEAIPGFLNPSAAGQRSGLVTTTADGPSGLPLSPYLSKPFKGQIQYGVRCINSVLEDKQKSDDFVTIVGPQVSMSELISLSIGELLAAFSAYYACLITNEDVFVSDYKRLSDIQLANRPAADKRHYAGRIWPLVYLDDLLCQRTFRLDAAEVVARAARVCEKTEIVNGGALIHFTSNPVSSPRELKRVHTTVMTAVAPEQQDLVETT